MKNKRAVAKGRNSQVAAWVIPAGQHARQNGFRQLAPGIVPDEFLIERAGFVGAAVARIKIGYGVGQSPVELAGHL